MKNILLVDDSLLIQEEVKHLLKGTDFVLSGYARTGEEGIVLYEECRPDIVLMDVIMPGIDGIDAARLLLKKHPEAKVVVGSSLAYDETEEMAKAAGVKRVIFKPYHKADMVKVLEEVINE